MLIFSPETKSLYVVGLRELKSTLAKYLFDSLPMDWSWLTFLISSGWGGEVGVGDATKDALLEVEDFRVVIFQHVIWPGDDLGSVNLFPVAIGGYLFVQTLVGAGLVRDEGHSEHKIVALISGVPFLKESAQGCPVLRLQAVVGSGLFLFLCYCPWVAGCSISGSPVLEQVACSADGDMIIGDVFKAYLSDNLRS